MKNYELNVEESNIKLTLEKNLLKRNEKLFTLIKLINKLSDNFIISIDGEWGSGKTFFVKQLLYLNGGSEESKKIIQKDIIEEFSKKYIPIYYNAWENDDHINPLESLIYNILNEYPKYKKNIESENKKFEIVKNILINIVDKSTFGILNKEVFDEFHSFEELATGINTIEEKKEALNKLIDNILIDDQRLLLVVDELDRCKPDFAVKMLETLKHFYNNKNITIIVATNNKQLSKSIKHFYGYEFDGYGYLNKIYDTVINLNVTNLEDYAKHHLEIMNKTWLPEDISYLLFKHLNFSYRECNKYMSIYRLLEPYINYKDNFKKDYFSACILLPMAIALKIKNIEIYNEFIEKKGNKFIKEFLDNIEIIAPDKGYTDWIESLLSKDNFDDKESLYEKFLKQYIKCLSSKDCLGFPFYEALSMLGNSINYQQ